MARRITDEKLNVEMSINGINKTQSEISKVQKSIRGLKNENQDLAVAKRKLVAEGKRQSAAYDELTKKQQRNRAEIDRYEKKQKDLQKQLGLTGMTMRQLTKHQRSLRAQMNGFVPNTPEWNKLNRELKETDKRLDSVRNEMKRTEGVMGRMKKSVGGFGALFLGGVSIGAVIEGGRRLLAMNADLSDSQANVMKTTGLTNKQVELLTRNLKKFDTRTPVNELLALAEEAGRLGKESVEDVMGFVQTADMIKVALGDDLQGDINENIQLIGKLSTQYQVGERFGVSFGKGMEKVGSAINEVAASGANQAGFLVDYLKRLVGISKQSGISAEQQLGFAAALDESGQSVEVSGTTMSRIIVDMYSNASEYAKIAKMSTEDFSKLLKEDANEALLKFLEGLNGNGEGLQTMTKKMEGLKLEGSRSVAVLTTLAANTDLVRQKQEVANKAIIDGTSLTQEFNVKNANLAGNLEKIGNAIGNYFRNSTLTGWLTDATSGILELNKEIHAQSNLLREQQFETNILVNSITSLNEGNDARDRLLKQLNKNYPDFLKNLDTEKVTNQQLRDRLIEVNAQYREKIKLAAFGEMQAENQANAIKLQREEEEKIIGIEKTRKALNIRKGKDLEDQLEIFKTEAKYGNIAKGVLAGVKGDYNRVLEIRNELKTLEKESLEIEQKKSKIKLGEDPSTPEGDETDNNNNDEATDDPDPGDLEKRLKALAELKEKYRKMEEDRLAESNEAKAILERDREIREAEALGASLALKKQIRDEWQVKIDEAKNKDQEEELENKRAFEERKKQLENEIALQREEDKLERELLQEEQQYERDQERLERELEQIQINEDQKNYLRQLLKERHEASITEIEARNYAERIENEKEFNRESARLSDQLEDAKARAQQRGLNLLSQFFNKKSGIYKALFLLEKGAAIAQVFNQTSKSLAEITANTAAANMKAVSASPLTGGMPWVAVNTALGAKEAATVKLNAAIQAASIGASAIQGVKGFEDGMYPDYVDVSRTDGKRFRAKNMGQTKTQVVNEPSYFRDYLTAEAGPELIVDNAVFRKMDPKVVDYILDLRKNVTGYEKGYYPAPAASGGSSGPSTDPELKAMLATLMIRLNEPLNANIKWGYDEVEKNSELQKEIDQSNNNGKITS